MTRAIVHLALILGVLGCLQTCFGTARAATSTRVALDTLCPGHEDLAEHVEAAALKHGRHPVLLVAVMRKESHCRMSAVGAAGEACAFQLHGVAKNGRTRAQLRDPATCIDTAARWLTRMVEWCGSLSGGLGAYNTGKCGKGQRYARNVQALAKKAWFAWEGKR